MERIKQRLLAPYWQALLKLVLSLMGFYILLVSLLLGIIYSNQLVDFWAHSAQQSEIVDYLLSHQFSGLLNVNYLNVSEKRHLLDVKHLYLTIEQGFQYSVLSALAIFILFKQHLDFKILLRNISYLGFSSFLLFIASNISKGFMLTFNYLHSPFFIKNTWLFPSDSYLIQLFPLEYFYHFSLLYLSLLLFCLSSFVLFIYYRK